MDDYHVVNEHELFAKYMGAVTKIEVTKHFKRDFPNFDINLVTDSEHGHFVRLHKYEENIDGIHVFRAFRNKKHIVYCIDGSKLVFLRAFRNFDMYKKYLNDKKRIILSVR